MSNTRILERVREERKATERLLLTGKAKDEVLTFARLMKPDPKDFDDPALSRYIIGPLHASLGATINRVMSGQHKRLIINVPPRHGKSELLSKIFPAFFIGADPYKSVIVGSYNEKIAGDYGKAVRGFIQSDAYSQVFPDVRLAHGSASVLEQQTEQGGQLTFAGINGTLTGRGGDLIIVDDPLKGTKEANSETTRNDLWTWFNNDLMSRAMSHDVTYLLIQTRWHEDDLVGRLTDPTNPFYNPDEAALWQIIDIPALAEKDDVLGRKVGEALWPQRFNREFLLSAQRRDPVGFSALYQQRPTPADGDYFKADWITEYGPRDVPPDDEMRFYIGCDFAVGQKQTNDKTCIVVAGVDSQDRIWLIDCFWERCTTLKSVEQLVKWIKRYEPEEIFGEGDHIVKSIGPFLRKRIEEENLWATGIKDVGAHADKRKKAQSIRARMEQKKVFFPRFAPWYAAARLELLKFDKATHDDFVDAIAVLGRELARMLSGKDTAAQSNVVELKPGTMGWMKQQSKRDDQRSRVIANMSSL